MDRARHRRNYDLHSWTGITLSLFVFIVSFSGCLALFYHEVLAWEDEAKRIAVPAEPIEMNDIYLGWLAERRAEGEVEFMNFRYPSENEPYYSAFAHVHETDGDRINHVDHWAYWHPATGEPISVREDGMARWLYDFHRDLMWPAQLGGRTIGRALVGVAGVILMLAIITGVIAHTKIREELFSLRYFRSVRLKWQDTHKILGLWGLPFYAMIAFTGAFLGIVAILAPIAAVLAFKGDQDALVEAVIGAPVEPTGVQAQMLSVDEVRRLTHPRIEGAPAYVIMHNWGDEAAEFDVYFESDARLAIYEPLYISGVTGEVLAHKHEATTSPGNRVTTAIAPLHYATFGGITLKYLYLILGLALCAITVMGNMMWIERRLHGNEGRRSERFYRGLSRLTVGVTCGIGVASAALLHHDKFYAGAESSRLFWTGWTYFIVWAIAIAYAFVRRDEYRATKDMIAFGGLLLALAPLTNGVMTGDFAWNALTGASNALVAWTDLAFLICGLLTIALAAVLPRTRPQTLRQRRRAAQIDADPAPAE